MIDIEKIGIEIVERLKPLDPDRIILFGSYAYGTPTEDSDIDIFIVKNVGKEKIRDYKLKARKNLRELIFKYEIGFDILSASEGFLKTREDYFYKEDILNHGKELYAK